MQLDLLHKDTAATSQDTKAGSARKSKPPHTQAPVLETKDICHTESLPPLPDSLRPPFAADEKELERLEEGKSPGAFKTISEVAKFLNVPQHVLRFWESRFNQIKPLKLNGGRRYYRPEDIEILSTIKHLLYKQGYTIKGAKKAFSLRKQQPAMESSSKPAKVMHATSPQNSAAILDKKHNQLAVLRQELIGLRDTLATYINK